MRQLSENNLPQNISLDYNRHEVSAGIVHFGVGNFHRTHQAAYCDKLISMGETQWGITGVSLRSSDMRDVLAPQDFLYTQVILDTEPTFKIIGSIRNILVAPANPTAVINQLSVNQVQLVTITITEKGYNLVANTINWALPALGNDLVSLKKPLTVYGFLAAGIIERFKKSGTPLTVLCCDNIQNGGSHLKQGVLKLVGYHCPAAITWLNENTSFCSSMVDRVSPSTDIILKEKVANHWRAIDAWPVSCEPFCQWVIEDNFAGERPPLDKAGAHFVKDITLYEQMKLRFFNAGHSIAATLGYLFGDQFIHEALNRPLILDFVSNTLKENIYPATNIPADLNGATYIQQVLIRIQNKLVPYKIQQVCTDSSNKIQQRWLPIIDDAFSKNINSDYLAFALAAWIIYINKALEKNQLNDVLSSDFTKHKNLGCYSVVNKYLILIGSDSYIFFTQADFMSSVCRYYKIISNSGIEKALINFFKKSKLGCIA